MRYLINNYVTYRGENIIMGNKRNKTEKILNSESYTFKRSTLKWFFGLCITFLSICISFLSFVVVQIISLNREISVIENIEENVKDINNGLNGKTGLYARLAVIENELDIEVSKIKNTSFMFSAYMGEVSNKYYSSDTKKYSLNSKILIGKDTNGNFCLAENYINKTILLTYKDKADNDMDVDVYFFGQYNENYHWDGFCVTNVYYSGGELDGRLHEICESDFDDGERLNFKSIHYNSEDNDWLYSDREIHTKVNAETNEKEKVNVGINKHYTFEYEKTKNFTSSNVKTSDIMYVDNFINNVKTTLTKFYSGNTSNGSFNDISGSAYRVTYYEDGTVESVYVGKFIDGYPNDDTMNAWQIYYSPKDKSYVYCKGQFENDNFIKGSKSSKNIIEIDEIIKEYNFECELKWREN